MTKRGLRKVATFSFEVPVTRPDIQEGECRLANRCMIRVAVERVLRHLNPKTGNHHTRVDAGHIRFNMDGYHWAADTPRIAKSKLIQFDKEARLQAKAKKAGESFTSTVEPFKFKVVAVRGKKIEPMTRERQEQINEARRVRIADNRADRKDYTLRQRIVGFA